MIGARSAFYLLFLLTFGFAVCHAQDARDAANSHSSTNKSASSRVIMKVGGVPVRQSEFESTIGDIEPQGDPDKQAENKDRRRLGDDYASVLMLSQMAVANHLDADPEIRQKLAVARMQILSDAEFTRLLAQTKPSDQEISNYYQAHLSDFDTVQVRRLFIWKTGAGSKNSHGIPADAAKAREAAILQASASGGDAVKLAEMFPASNEGLFDQQPLTFVRGQLPPKMDKAAFTMKVGQWTEAENTPDHTILIYLTGRDRQKLSEVLPMVSKMVQGEKMQAKLNGLKKKTGIWMDEQYFGSGSAGATEPGEQHPGPGAPLNSGNH